MQDRRTSVEASLSIGSVPLPLSGFRVVDLTRVVAGPFCTMLLADLGAEVIKIEPPGEGDPIRAQGAIRNGISWYYAGHNRNKKSLALDLYQAEGKAVLADLIARSDVLVENYRPGVLAKMGFDEARLKALNPGLVVASVNGYGSTGPYAERPAFDFIAQAMSGFMSVNGFADGPPLRAANPISDLVAGLYAALGVAAALANRTKGGGGQRLETSLLTGMISLLSYIGAAHLATGKLPARTGNAHHVVAPYGLFRAADGEIAVAPSYDEIVERFLGAIGLKHLLDDPLYADNAARLANRASLNALVDEAIGRKSREDWIGILNKAGVPCGRVLNLAEMFADPQVQAQEMVLAVPHPGHDVVRMTGFPIKFEGTPCRIRRHAPALGEHTGEVLRLLGRDEAEIARLKAKGIV
ncbi:MAG: CoA transferase [Alphaproteobacteria bacterium]|nr:CoA transferase [Alphaproteobacteria bacterium]